MPYLLPLIATLSFSQTVRVTPVDLTSAREPQVAIDTDKRVYVAYGVGDSLFVSSSLDGGKSYGAPVLVGAPAKLSLGMRRGPRIAAHRGVITITAVYGVQGRGKDEDLLAFQSKDSGRTWSTPVKVNNVAGSAREGLHAMAQAPNGTVACAWLDLRDAGTKLFVSTSRDGGATWGDNVLAYESPSGTICECCHPSLAFDRSGALYILFRNSLDGNRDMYLIKTSDMRKFSAAKKLGAGNWKLSACPMDGGMLAVSSKGEVATVWRRDGSIYSSQEDRPEVLVAEGRNPWMASLSAGSVMTWQNGRTVMAAFPGKSGEKIAPEGSSPVVTSAPDGTFAVIAWANRGIESFRVDP